MKGCSNFSTKLVYQPIRLKLVLTLYGHKYYKFMIIDIAIRNQFQCIQKLIISIKMLFPVYFFNKYLRTTKAQRAQRKEFKSLCVLCVFVVKFVLVAA